MHACDTNLTGDAMNKDQLIKEYEALKSRKYQIDMTRGKPCKEQLNLSNNLLNIDISKYDFSSSDGIDVRNYGILEGIDEARDLMAEIMEDEAQNTLVIGNSSLQLMYDTIQRTMQYGILGNKPWNKYNQISFLCPSPGYDRHFAICETLGINMIPIDMKVDSPDMDKIENLVNEDETIKGIWCVPQYSNPTGTTYSDDTVMRLASMKTAAPDFRIFWDNAYSVHHLYQSISEQEHVYDIRKACEEAGNVDRYYKFASLSKVTFPGSAIAGFASSSKNIMETKRLLGASMIGSDKINQLRHVKFLPNKKAVLEHMEKHAQILRPKFELVNSILEEELGGLNIAKWSNPRGGYFINFKCLSGSAKEVVSLANDCGIKFTSAGASWPYGQDPNDEDIRIAPSMPSRTDLEIAIKALALCTKISSL